ncbi:5909_t:CDS:2 [Funneliformis geosporum]|uniref:5909_t:CDS:1 n=1 Tax=Funneliformis geosporum TaxID=1117311 RepID=A0A9W4SAU2_9GLOM|nr:5909_t:CDS:2 [Funneliformis geosporum]
MATNTTSHHLTPPTPPTSSRQRNPPSPRTQSKSILSIALQKAQAAVQFDAANNVAAALDAYKQTVELLFQVIDKAVNEADRRRLQLIVIDSSDNDNDNDLISSEQNDDENDITTQNSTDSSVNAHSLHRADSVGQNSVSENDSQTDGNEITSSSSMIRNINGKSIEIDNSHNNNETHLANGTVLTNGVGHHNRNDTVDYITPQPKRLSLSHRSNASVSTSRSWISTVSDKTTPASIFEVSLDGAKTVADSSDNGESTSRSSDLDSSSEDIDSSSNTINDYLQSSDSYGASSEIMEENLSYQNQGSSSQQLQEQTGMEEKNSSATSQVSSLSKSSSLRLGSSSSNRLFVAPPPPKVAPPPTTPPSPSDQFRQNEASVFSPPDTSALMGRRSTSPTIVPPPSVTKQSAALQSSLHEPVNESMLGSSSQTMSDEDDDKVSVKSVPSSFTRPSSSSMEKLLGKALPQSRRPAPLPLQNNYSSRIIPTRIPSNPNLAVTTNNSTVLPRRTASNPGNTPKKIGSVRFFNSNSQPSSNPLSQIPGTPSSPWISSFSIISPPLGSPGFGPQTGYFRSETPSLSTKHNDASYSACLINPLPNTFYYDDPHMSSNNGLFEPTPNDLHLNPFWLMKKLERTMTTGGYLTPKLFIPRNLWLQGHVKLVAIDTKMSSCEVVSTCLMKLSKTTYNDMDKLAKELECIDPILEGLQNSLARKLNYVESTNGKGRQSTSSLMNWGSKLSRGLDRMGMGNAMVRTEEANGYVDVLLKVFQQAGVVENYIRHFTSLQAPYHHHHKQILSRLHKFADFFGNVICRFVVKDLGVLTDKY